MSAWIAITTDQYAVRVDGEYERRVDEPEVCWVVAGEVYPAVPRRCWCGCGYSHTDIAVDGARYRTRGRGRWSARVPGTQAPGPKEPNHDDHD